MDFDNPKVYGDTSITDGLEYGARGTPKTLKRKNTGNYRLRSKVTLGNTIKSSPGVPHDTPPVNI